ncbi:hypothetical protein [Listeria seeligeri]|uniref:hypothetical protein n=1 Tax=Listeria seeligeri TaxID=1640 RepID=UPI00311ADDCF
MTHIISAFPGLGKTTIFTLNKDTIFDREFNESRSIQGMTSEGQTSFFQHCADMVQLQKKTGYYNYLFITDHPALVERLKTKSITHIYPNVFQTEVMAEYKQRLIKRSGLEWYERVMPPKISHLKARIQQLYDCDVRLTDLEHRYIEDVFEFKPHIKLPKDIERIK